MKKDHKQKNEGGTYLVVALIVVAVLIYFEAFTDGIGRYQIVPQQGNNVIVLDTKTGHFTRCDSTTFSDDSDDEKYINCYTKHPFSIPVVLKAKSA